MLDVLKGGPKPQPTARALAQMRMLTQPKGLPDGFADAMAEAGLAPAMVDPVIEGLVTLVDNAKTFAVAMADWQKLAEDLITRAGAAPAAAPSALAGEILLEYKAAHDVNHVNHGSTASVGRSWDNPIALAQKLADARAAILAPRMGLKHEPTLGRDMGSDSLSHARIWAQSQGLRFSRDSEAMEAFVTGRVAGPMMWGGSNTRSDFPTIAGGTVQILVGRALEQAPVGLAQCVNKIGSTDFRARKLANTSAASSLTLTLEGDDLVSKYITESGEAIPAPSRYAGLYRATNELLRNSVAGGLDLEAAITKSLLAAAQETQRSILSAAISANANMADGNAVFSAAHANLNASATAITVASIGVARTGMQRFVDAQGAARPVTPAILLVPPEKQTEAEQLVTAITAAKLSDVNPFSAGLRVVVDPGLVGTATFYWYLLPDPDHTDGLAMIYLDDMPTPSVESQDAWPNYGMEWRIQWPLASAFVRSSWFRTLGA